LSFNQKSIQGILSYLSQRGSQLSHFLNRPQVKKWVRRLISIAWILLLGFILWGGWKFRDEIIPNLRHANITSLFVGMVFLFLAFVSAICGWIMILNKLTTGIKPWTHIYIYCATIASRRAPGTVWYIGGRISLYQNWGVSPVKTSVASTIEIILSLISGGMISLVLLPFGLKLPDGVIALFFLGSLAGIALLHPNILGSILRKIKHPLDQPLSMWNTVSWLIPYIFTWISGGLMFYHIIIAFYPLSVSYLPYIIGAWASAGVGGLLTIFLPSSFGVTDITLTVFLAAIMPMPMAVLIAVINRLLSAMFEVILSAIFYFFLKDLKPDH
jgi:hypothetical protein